MGNFTSHNQPTLNSMYYGAFWKVRNHKNQDFCLKIDRILDAEHQIYIGIGTRKHENDAKMSLQVVRIGDYTNKYYRLMDFSEEKNKLKYKFEDDVTMILKKTEEGFHIELSDVNNQRVISNKIDPFIINQFKTISMASSELDKIYSLFHTIE